MICNKVFLVSICAMIFGGSVSLASAQQAATASLSGAVKDANGALVGGAQITVKQKATGASRDTSSNGDGFFVITNLAAGTYELQVRAKGFAEKIIPAVDLQVGQTFNLELQLAVTVQETVTLDDRYNYDLVNTSTAAVDGGS